MLCSAVIWLTLPGVVEAQTLLRWKLKPGESFIIDTKQQTESQVAFSGKSAMTKIDVDLQLGWLITAADENQITLKQTIERMSVTLASPQSAKVEFDSAAKGRPTGQARELAAGLQPLIGAEIEITMDARGSILAAKPVNDAAKQLLAADEKGGDAGDASRGAIEQLLRQPLVVLPEKAVAANDEWSVVTELAAAAGAVKQETTYRLAGSVEQEGQQLQRIETKAALAAQLGASGKASDALKIESHQQTGQVLFSANEGRLIESEQTQKLVTERPYRETTIVVTLNSTQKTTMTPKP